MAKYVKLFEKHSDYQDFINSEGGKIKVTIYLLSKISINTVNL